jgi:G3E family GTPase
MTAGSTRLPLTVVGGYLGAGKTTLVNRLLADPRGQRIAVLVNDFGEIGIDEVLIGEAADDPSILSLANGCVCCSLAEGFAETLGKVRGMAHRLDRVVVEVSGVGEPAKVARWSRTPGFSPDGVVVVVDGSRIGEQLEDRRIGETVAAQVADADLLLLTRADLLDDEALAAAEAVLQPHSSAPTLRSPADPALLFGLEPVAGGSDADEHEPRDSAHAEHVSCSRVLREPIHRDTLDLWFQVRPRGVVRAKGILRMDGSPDMRSVVQVAGNHTSVTTSGAWSGDEPGGEAGAGAVVAIAVPGTPRAALVKWLGMLDS